MFGFGWVRTHLRVVFGDVFGLFWGFWLDLWQNGLNQQNLAISGVLSCNVGIPHSSVGPCQGMACPRRGVAERGLGQASGMPRRSYYSQRVDFCVLFRFAIPLFQRLVYWTIEDPISV